MSVIPYIKPIRYTDTMMVSYKKKLVTQQIYEGVFSNSPSFPTQIQKKKKKKKVKNQSTVT